MPRPTDAPPRRPARTRAWRRLLTGHWRRAPAPWPLLLSMAALLLVTTWPVALAATLVVWWVALPIAAALRAHRRGARRRP